MKLFDFKIGSQIIFFSVVSSTFLTFVSTSIYDNLSTKIVGGQIIGALVCALFLGLIHYWLKKHFLLKDLD